VPDVALPADSVRPSPSAMPALAAPKPSINPWLIAIIVSMATFMEVLDTSIANVSLTHIAGNLGASQDEATWVLTSYLVSNAIIMPISGWLANVMGRKRFYMSCVALFTFASFLCGLAPSLGWLLVFRVLQGAGGGGLAPSEQSILADTFSPKQRGMAFAVYGLAVVVAPAIGPTLGGWITDNYNWRWIFYINVPVGCLSLFLTDLFVQDSWQAKLESANVWKNGLKIDYIGFGLVALGLGALQVVLDKGQEDDWFGSNFIIVATIIAVVGLATMFIWETRVAKEPIVDLRLLKIPNFLVSVILMFVVGFILTSTTQLLPQFVQQLLGYDATTAGMVLMGGGFTLMCVMPIAGILVGRMQPKWLIMIGILGTAAAMYNLTFLDTNVPFSTMVWARIYQCIFLPLFFIPINTLAYSDLPVGRSNNASALLNLARNLGGAIGISIAITLLTRRSQFHMERLSAHLTPFDLPFKHELHLLTGRLGHDSAMRVIYESLQQQAAMLSYQDVFKIMAIACLPVAVVVLFFKKIKPGEHTDAPMH
jgi:DHA2 family multidrug resistance protein